MGKLRLQYVFGGLYGKRETQNALKIILWEQPILGMICFFKAKIRLNIMKSTIQYSRPIFPWSKGDASSQLLSFMVKRLNTHTQQQQQQQNK